VTGDDDGDDYDNNDDGKNYREVDRSLVLRRFSPA
jgi:hypothetical protein